MSELSTEAYEDCIGVHLSPTTEEHLSIDWQPIRSGTERVRIQDYTCDCQPTFYELCQAGGLLFIRRTRRTPNHLLVDESPRAGMLNTLILWASLLQGSAPPPTWPATRPSPTPAIVGRVGIPARHAVVVDLANVS